MSQNTNLSKVGVDPYRGVPISFRQHLLRPASIVARWNSRLSEGRYWNTLIVFDVLVPCKQDDERHFIQWYVRLFSALDNGNPWQGLLEYGRRTLTLHIFIRTRGDQESSTSPLRRLASDQVGVRIYSDIDVETQYLKGLEHPGILLGDGLFQGTKRKRDRIHADDLPLWIQLCCRLAIPIVETHDEDFDGEEGRDS